MSSRISHISQARPLLTRSLLTHSLLTRPLLALSLMVSALMGCGGSQVNEVQELRAQPGPALRFDLVELFLHSKAYDVAAPIAQKLYQRYPRDHRPPLYLGIILRERRVFEQAERYLLESIQRAPDHALAYDALGVLYGMQGKVQAAIKAHKHATKLDSNVAKFWHNLGFAYSVARSHEHAIEAYQRALSIAPEHHPTYVNLGITYGVLGRYSEAREALVQALSPAEVSFNLGLIQERRGDLELAVTSLRRAVESRIELKRSREALARVVSRIAARRAQDQRERRVTNTHGQREAQAKPD